MVDILSQTFGKPQTIEKLCFNINDPVHLWNIKKYVCLRRVNLWQCFAEKFRTNNLENNCSFTAEIS